MNNSSETNKVVELIECLSTEQSIGCLAFFGHWWGGMADCDFEIISYAANHNVLTLDLGDGGYSDYQFSIDITAPRDTELLEDALVIWQADELVAYCRSDKKHTAPNSNFFTKYKLIEGDIYYANSDLSFYFKPVPHQPAFEIAWFVPSGMRKMYHRERGKVRKFQKVL